MRAMRLIYSRLLISAVLFAAMLILGAARTNGAQMPAGDAAHASAIH